MIDDDLKKFFLSLIEIDGENEILSVILNENNELDEIIMNICHINPEVNDD